MAYGTYVVQTGDNWFTIAEKFDTKPSVLIKLNKSTVDAVLKKGTSIKVPEAAVLKLDVKRDLPRFADLNKRLLSDANYRKTFLKDPAKAMKDLGISIDPALFPKDLPILRLIDDATFHKLIKTGDRVGARKYLRERYPELMPAEVRGATHYVETVDAVVDAGVAIPVVAVADPIC